MGMSIDNGPSIDFAAIVAGGDEFMRRMQAFKDAKETAEAAVHNLKLGKSAKDALDEASRIRDEAKAKRDIELANMMAQIAEAKKQADEYAAATKAAAAKAMAEAQARLDQANAKHAAIASLHSEAANKVNSAHAEANTTLNNAKAQADAILAEAKSKSDALLANATLIQKAAQDAHANAQQVKAKYDNALAAIQAAIIK